MGMPLVNVGNQSINVTHCNILESLMSATIDYYFSPPSPWTYLGHARFSDMVRRAGASIRLLPADFGKVFAVSGGLPLGQRAPQRQAYRLVELARFSQHLHIPMNLKPRFFPVAGDDAARLIIAVDQHDGVEAAMRLSGAIFEAVWRDERNIADAAVLAELLSEQGLSAQRQQQAGTAEVTQRYEANTQQAIDKSVFGAPTYVVDGEIFWGQDRLDFVERKLMSK
jgi:2-hydroxychromene-2-carboxylate isomerase